MIKKMYKHKKESTVIMGVCMCQSSHELCSISQRHHVQPPMCSLLIKTYMSTVTVIDCLVKDMSLETSRIFDKSVNNQYNI